MFLINPQSYISRDCLSLPLINDNVYGALAANRCFIIVELTTAGCDFTEISVIYLLRILIIAGYKYKNDTNTCTLGKRKRIRFLLSIKHNKTSRKQQMCGF